MQGTRNFMFCYIYAQLWNSGVEEEWARSGFATYFCTRYDTYSVAAYNAVYRTADDRFLQLLRSVLDREIDVNQDWVDLNHLYAWYTGYDDPNAARGEASFVIYLIERFGEEQVIEMVLRTRDLGEYTYEELVADWQAYLSEHYSSYGAHESNKKER